MEIVTKDLSIADSKSIRAKNAKGEPISKKKMTYRGDCSRFFQGINLRALVRDEDEDEDPEE